LCGRFQRQRAGFAEYRPNHHECFFVLRFDLILDGDCTQRSQFDKNRLRHACMAASRSPLVRKVGMMAIERPHFMTRSGTPRHWAACYYTRIGFTRYWR
jgi:hypothetical protein